MKKELVIGIIIIVLIVLLVVIFYPKSRGELGLRECIKDSDCIIVEGKSCCACPTSINKDYLDYWDTIQFEECSGLPPLCKICPSLDGMEAICKNNLCNWD